MTSDLPVAGTASAADKPALRRALVARRAAVSGAERAAAEAALCNRLFSLPAWQSAPTVLGYMSVRGEMDLLPVWREADRAGKTFALPATLDGAGEMCFRSTPGFCPDALTAGRFGIPEPPAGTDFLHLALADLSGALILVPGLAFDEAGFRLGYGGGYYDRFLDALTAARVSVTTVGLCFADCRVDRIPREPHDRAVDIVLFSPS